MPPQVHAHFQPWQFSSLITCALLVVSAVYLRGWLRLRRVRRIAPSRLVAFLAGLFSVWLALASPLAVLDEQLLTVHMVKHLLLMAVSAPLILFGKPALPLSDGLLKRLTHPGQIFRSRAPQSLVHSLGNPVLCWFAGTAVVIVWHVPTMFGLAMSSHLWHIVEYASFLAAGLLFWGPIVRPWPGGAKSSEWLKPLYLFLATLPCDILSGFLVFCGRVVYSSYESAYRGFNLSALQDQQCAGALMWVFVTFAYLVPAFVITVRILSPMGLHAHRSELVVVPVPASSELNGPRAEVV